MHQDTHNAPELSEVLNCLNVGLSADGQTVLHGEPCNYVS